MWSGMTTSRVGRLVGPCDVAGRAPVLRSWRDRREEESWQRNGRNEWRRSSSAAGRRGSRWRTTRASTPAVRDPRRERARRRLVAETMALAAALLARGRRRAARDALPCAAVLLPDRARDGRVPRDVRRALRTPRRERGQRRQPRPRRRRVRDLGRREALRGGQRRRRDRSLPPRASRDAAVRRRARPRDRAAPLRGLPRPRAVRDGPVLVVGASHSGGDIAYELARAGFRTVLSGPDTGQFPLDIESRFAPLVFPLLRFAATRLLTVSTPLGRKARPHIRGHGGPLIRREEGRPRGGRCRACARAHDRRRGREAGARQGDGPW